MSSKVSSVMLLLISSNFVEVKGMCAKELYWFAIIFNKMNANFFITRRSSLDVVLILTALHLCIVCSFVSMLGLVFKRFDESNLFQITCSDITERFFLFLSLFCVFVQNTDFTDGATWVEYPLVFECCVRAKESFMAMMLEQSTPLNVIKLILLWLLHLHVKITTPESQNVSKMEVVDILSNYEWIHECWSVVFWKHRRACFY